MPATESVVLAINAGSSSVKFALYYITIKKRLYFFPAVKNDVPKHPGLADIIREFIQEVQSFISFDPERLPAEIKLIEQFLEKFLHLMIARLITRALPNDIKNNEYGNCSD
jgi:acetate kinase